MARGAARGHHSLYIYMVPTVSLATPVRWVVPPFTNMESKAHLDAWVQTGCPSVSTSLKKKQAQGGHVLTWAQPGICLMPHLLSSTRPPPLTPALALGGLGSRMPSSEGSRH